MTLDAVNGRTLVRLRRQVVAPTLASEVPAGEVDAELLRLREALEGSA